VSLVSFADRDLLVPRPSTPSSLGLRPRLLLR